MKCLLAVGACYMDTVLNVDHYPTEDEKLRASSIIRRRGGNCPNTLEVLQQLLDSNSPIGLALCAVLPSTSSRGYQEIKSSLGSSVDLSHCIPRKESSEPASSYVVRSRATDSRTIINYNGLREMIVNEFASVVDHSGQGLSWCHFEGRIPDVTLSCIRHLRKTQPTVKISVEVEKPGREGLQDLAAAANVVFYSKNWAQGNGYKSAEDCLRSQATLAPKASLLCCTWGESGAASLELPSQTYTDCQAFKVEGCKPIDTVCAGDTFIAGMLFGLICRDSWTSDRRLTFANELAGRKVAQEGLQGVGKLMTHVPGA